MFGGFTVTVNVVLVEVVPSLTETVIVAVPTWPEAGVTVTVRLAPEPLMTMFAFGTSVVFEEEPVTVRLVTAVSASPTMKESAVVALFFIVLTLEMLVMVGALLV